MLDVALPRRQISCDSAARIVVTGHTAVRRPATGARRAPPSPGPGPVYSAKAAPRHAVNPIRAVTAIRADHRPRRHAARAFCYPGGRAMIEQAPRSRRHRVAPPPRVRLRGGRTRPWRRHRGPGRGRSLHRSRRLPPRDPVPGRGHGRRRGRRLRGPPRPATAGSPSSTSRASTPATRTRRRSSSGWPPPSPAGRPPTSLPRPTSSRCATS